ncbi:TetR/AcrR family transcriptional regulator [Mycobacterium stomatepiae]|nr:TetR/AcrR family transcriptional regulator [Mycobacterium stomatepiae]MCV7167246.1 TetR/AcrR family transcriptional regulator [Mycobacterium stomatepiae]
MAAKSRARMLLSAADYLGRRPAATMDEIAVAVGVSRATLHRHFAGRPALIEALREAAITALKAVLVEAQLTKGSAVEALQRLVLGCEPVAGYLVLLYSQELDFAETLVGFADLDRQITDLFARGQRDGEFRTDLTAVWLTEAFYSLVATAEWSIQLGKVARRDFSLMIAGLMLEGILGS